MSQGVCPCTHPPRLAPGLASEAPWSWGRLSFPLLHGGIPAPRRNWIGARSGCPSQSLHVVLCMHVCMHVCVHMRMHVCACIYACICVCMCVRVHVCPCACVHVCMRICVHLCMHMCTCACNPAQPGVQFQRGRGRENRIAHQEPLKEKDLGSANRFNFAADLRNHRATFLRLLFQPAQQMEGSISRLFPLHIALPWGQHGFVQTPWTRQQGWRACHASSPSHSPCSAALEASGGQQSPGKLLPAPPGRSCPCPWPTSSGEGCSEWKPRKSAHSP